MNEKVFIICVEISRIALKNRLEQVLSNISSTKIEIVEGVYAIRASRWMSSTRIRDLILKEMGTDFELFVTRSSIDASWRLNSAIASWLNANI